MKKIVFALSFSLGFSIIGLCQTSETGNSKSYNSIIGVQVNELIRQIFTSSTSSVSYPYLLNYSYGSKETGWGFRVGIGGSHNQNANNTNSVNSNSNSTYFSGRVGIEKSYSLSKKWSAGIGFDVIYNYNNIGSNNTNYFTTDSTVNNTKSDVSTYGGGFMGWLRYSITDRIIVGTETSFYYAIGTKNQYSYQSRSIIDTTLPTGKKQEITEMTSKNSISQGNFNLPAIFFIIVKF